MPFHVEVTPNPAQNPNWFRPVQFDDGVPIRYIDSSIAYAAATKLREIGAGITGYRVRVVLAPANPPR